MQFVEARAAMPAAMLYPDLAGARVLITGTLEPQGVLLGYGFAGHGCKLVVQLGLEPARSATSSQPTLANAVSTSATGALRVLPADFADADGVDRFADAALRTWGGLDVVVNIVRLDPALAQARTDTELADGLRRLLQAPLQLTRRAVARMRETRTRGAVINVLATAGAQPAAAAGRSLALHALARTALETMTQGEARAAFEDGIRVHGLVEVGAGDRTKGPGPDLADLAMEAANGEVLDDIATSALFLASARGGWLNGATLAVGGSA